jgi:hypothetical protein
MTFINAFLLYLNYPHTHTTLSTSRGGAVNNILSTHLLLALPYVQTERVPDGQVNGWI